LLTNNNINCKVKYKSSVSNIQTITVIWFLNVLTYRLYCYYIQYYSRFIPEGAAEESQTLLRDTPALTKLVRNTADVTGGKPIAFLSQSISNVSVMNPLVAFYHIHGRKEEVLFFYFVPNTTWQIKLLFSLKYFSDRVKFSNLYVEYCLNRNWNRHSKS
jgi:hypothetical protein